MSSVNEGGGNGHRGRRHALAALAVLAVVAGILVTRHFLLRSASGETPGEAIGIDRELEPSPPSRELAAPTPGSEEDPQRTEASVERIAEQATGESEGQALPEPGVVRLRVRDGINGLPLPGVTVRFLGQHRFAEVASDDAGLVECRLTPDLYRIGVQHDPHERVLIDPTEVTSGVELELPDLYLWEGSSRLDVRLTDHDVRLDRPYLVELRGVGRNPCPQCRARFRPPPGAATEVSASKITPRPVQRFELSSGELRRITELVGARVGARDPDQPGTGGESSSPEVSAPEAPGAGSDGKESRRSLVPASTCSHCGYDREFSTREIWPGGSFAFDNLTSGRYRLLARRDPAAAADAEELVEVEPATRHLVDLVVLESTSLELELRDVDGNLFDGNWWDEPDADAEAAGPVPGSATIRYRFFASERQIAVARTAPASRSRSGRPEAQALYFSFANLNFDIGSSDRQDREATASDQLWPGRSTPDAPTATLPVERLGDSRHRVLRVPCRRLEVEVRCGPWSSERIPLDLGFVPPQPVIVILQRTGRSEPAPAVIQGSHGTLRLDGLTLENLQISVGGSEED